MVRRFLNHATKFSVGVVARTSNSEGFSTRALNGWLTNVANTVVVEVQLVGVPIHRTIVSHGENLVVIGVAVGTAPFVNIPVKVVVITVATNLVIEVQLRGGKAPEVPVQTTSVGIAQRFIKAKHDFLGIKWIHSCNSNEVRSVVGHYAGTVERTHCDCCGVSVASRIAPTNSRTLVCEGTCMRPACSDGYCVSCSQHVIRRRCIKWGNHEVRRVC